MPTNLEQGGEEAGNSAQDRVEKALDLNEESGNNGVERADQRAENDEQGLQESLDTAHYRLNLSVSYCSHVPARGSPSHG